MTPEQLAKSGSEHGHQRAFFCDLMQLSYEVWEATYSIPNGASTGGDALGRQIQGGKLKAEGLKRGVPDICVAWPYGGYAGLYIEMKKPKKGRLSQDQLDWHTRLRKRGYKVVVAPHWQLAINEVSCYFGLGPKYVGPF